MGRPMKIDRALMVAFSLTLLTVAGCGTDNGDQVQLSAAETTMNSFLTAVQKKDGSSAYALLSKDFRVRLSAEEQKSKVYNVNFGGSPITFFAAERRALSRSKDRATFNGQLGLQPGFNNSPFTMVVAKEDGDWRVDGFTVGQ